ncbi:hypothetical protein [Streptomyces chartreusis]|uniref:hypothetical protein n=1 Tax=Streptomyces chartreusis TaxID=1969 RepID=UPI003660D47B
MGRSRNSGSSDGCVGIVVLALIIGFLANQCDDEPESEPTPRPAVTVTETVPPPDFPEEEAEPDLPETEPDLPETGPDVPEAEVEEDDNSGTGGQDNGQAGIQFGYACSPVGALGTAEDGRPAKCFLGKDGRARWGYDSNRG